MTAPTHRDAAWRTGSGLVLSGCGVAGLAFYASLLPWRFGVWTDTEPMVVAMHLGAALCALGLLLCAGARPRLVGRIVGHPVVLVALFVAAWSALTAPFADYPLLSLLGSPQLGEGALYHADLAAFLATGLLLRRLPSLRRVGFAVGAAICAFTPLLVVALRIGGWWGASRPLVFDDYLAYYAIVGATFVLAMSKLPLAGRASLAVIVALPGLSVSGNLTAIVVMLALALPAALIVQYGTAWSSASLRRVRVALALSVPMLAGAGLLAVWLIGQTGEVASLASRMFMYRALLPVVTEQPAVLAVGQGWGNVNASVLANLAQSGATIWDGSWDLSTRDIPHSHNFAVEALSGAGLPAMIGVLALLAAVPATARRRDLPVVAFTVISLAGLRAMWFELPATVGIAAIALGWLAGPVGTARRSVVPARRWLTMGFAALVIAQAAALTWLVGYGIAVQRADRADYRSADGGRCGAFPADDLRGSVGLTQAFGDAFGSLFATDSARTPVPAQRWDRLERLYCEVAGRVADSRSVRLMLADLVFRAQVAVSLGNPEVSRRFATALPGWEGALRRFLARAPGRTDMAAPYLAWRLARGESGDVVSFARDLLRRNPDDPVGHWFLGAALAATPSAGDADNRQQALQHMRGALSLGVQRYIKVDRELIRLLTPKP
jgi:hypothetical protein